MSPRGITPEFLWRKVVNGSKVLKSGNNGVEVEVLQQRLQQLGYDISTIDGDFGNGTKRAVIAFQTDVGQSADGVVGPGTANAIEDAIKASTNTQTSSSSGSGSSSALVL